MAGGPVEGTVRGVAELGDGGLRLIETLRHDGGFVRLGRHLARLHASARRLGWVYDAGRVEGALADVTGPARVHAAVTYTDVARWDDDLALQYKWNEAGALRNQGDFRGDNPSLEKAIVTYGEALALLEEGRGATEIDAAMIAAGYRIGPFSLIDLIGADINLATTQGLAAAMGGHPRYHVFGALQAQVERGELGRKSGRGFIFPDAPGAAPKDS